MNPALLAALLMSVEAPGLVFGPEIDVAATALTGAPGDQTISAAAFDGKTLLVAWRTPLWKSELRVARATLAGEVLERRGVRVDGFERDEGAVAVAARPGGFLLAWSKEPNRTFAAVVTTDGELKVGPPLLVNEGPTDVTSWGPVATWNGSSFWVLWSRGGAGIAGARVGPEGQLLDATPVKIASAAADLAAAADGTTLVAWPSVENGKVVVRGARLDAEKVLDLEGASIFEMSGDRAGPVAVSAGGGGFAVAASAPGAGTHAIGVARVGMDGRSLDGAGLALDSGAGEAAGGPTAAWNGSGFHVVWAVDALEGGRHSPRLAGSVLGAGAPAPWTAATGAGRKPVLAPTGATPVLLWSQIASWDGDGAPVDGDLWMLPPGGKPALVSAGANAESAPAVAWSGRRLMVAWEDRRDDRIGGDVYAARLDDQGQPLDGSGLALGTGPSPQQAPAVAWDGQRFVVAWNQGADGLALAVVDENGKLAGSPLVVSGTAAASLLSNPGLCADGDGALLVWAGRGELRGLRVPRGGTVQDGQSFLLAAVADTDTPPVMRLECNEQGGVVVWSGKLAGDTTIPLYLGHILRGASRFTAPPHQLQPKEDSEWSGLASDGKDFLVAWRNFDTMGRRRVVSLRVAGDGRLLDDFPRAVGNSNSGVRVNAVWNGREYMVFAINTQNDQPFELRGHRVALDNIVRERDWFTVSPLALDIGDTGTGSAGVYLGGGRSFLVHDRFFDPDATANTRVLGRFITTADEPDAGAPAGDGSPDAGAPLTPPSSGSGCGCRIGGRESGGALVVALAVTLVAGTRRRRRGR